MGEHVKFQRRKMRNKKKRNKTVRKMVDNCGKPKFGTETPFCF